MQDFSYRDNELYAEDVAVRAIADDFGTPCYIYSRAAIERQWCAFDRAFGDYPHLICYAVKANSNLAVLNILARLGSGFDIVSVGELERVLKAGGDPAKIIFSGVGKRTDEMARALQVGIRCFNVESGVELEQLNDLAARLGKVAPVSIRVNPDVDADTHPYISTGLKENKFGISIDQAFEVYRRAAALAHIQVCGIDCHIGSQLTRIEPYIDTIQRLLQLVERLARAQIEIEHIDLGGGLGIRYRDEQPPHPADQAAVVLAHLKDFGYEILLEPGRAIVGNSGILATRVNVLKQSDAKNFAVVDAAMNDLLRPSLYSAWLDIVPVSLLSQAQARYYDIVGPVCESADFLGKERELKLCGGDLLAVCSAGAYGFAMSSNYNSRPRAAEVMVDGAQAYLIRKRETIQDLFSAETVLPLHASR